MQNYKALGKIRDAHGIKGEVFLISFSKKFEWLENLNTAYLSRREQNTEGEWVETLHTFPIKRKKSHKVGQILKLEGMDTRNDAESFKGASFQVPQEVLDTPNADGSFFLLQLEDFTVNFNGQTEKGKITGFGSNSAQDLLLIEWNQKTVEIPYVEAFIKDVSFDAKEITLDVPEGLLFLEDL
ncbi:MAG: 16S rRNA processing protein RimM [Bdellovibrionales bacterium]|nr:16S rRNA processing protein RimM [Bdellovibrionales bacterium]